MNFYNEFIDINLKKDMGITGITDEFFCVYLKIITSIHTLQGLASHRQKVYL